MEMATSAVVVLQSLVTLHQSWSCRSACCTHDTCFCVVMDAHVLLSQHGLPAVSSRASSASLLCTKASHAAAVACTFQHLSWLNPAHHPGDPADYHYATYRPLCSQPGQRVLDVGCGTGGSAYDISEAYNVHVHGLDLSVNCLLSALERASTRSGDVTFEVADVTSHNLPAASFDAVHCRDALLHVADTPCALSRFACWLRPGGRLLITDYCAPSTSLSDGMKQYVEGRKYSLLSAGQYEEAVAAAGFENVEVKDLTDEVSLGGFCFCCIACWSCLVCAAGTPAGRQTVRRSCFLHWLRTACQLSVIAVLLCCVA